MPCRRVKKLRNVILCSSKFVLHYFCYGSNNIDIMVLTPATLQPMTGALSFSDAYFPVGTFLCVW